MHLSQRVRETIESVNISGDMVQFNFIEEVDTIYNLNEGDVIRKFDDDYIFNQKYEDVYGVILLRNDVDTNFSIRYLETEVLSEYYMGFMTDKMDVKTMVLEAGEAVKMKNSELRYFTENDLFTLWHTIQKCEIIVETNQ